MVWFCYMAPGVYFLLRGCESYYPNQCFGACAVLWACFVFFYPVLYSTVVCCTVTFHVSLSFHVCRKLMGLRQDLSIGMTSWK